MIVNIFLKDVVKTHEEAVWLIYIYGLLCGSDIFSYPEVFFWGGGIPSLPAMQQVPIKGVST